MIRDLLSATSLAPVQRAQLGEALGASWIWPVDPDLAGLARGWGFEVPDGLPGEALLVSGTGALGRLECRGDLRARELGEGELETLEETRRLVTVGLPFAFGIEPAFAARSWRARHLAGNPPLESDDDGASLGGAMSLALGSLLMRVPVPEDLAVAAAVGEDGALRPVPAMAERIAVLRATALGVSRLGVALSQQAEACAEAARQCCHLQVVGVRTLEGLYRLAFPRLHISPPAWLCGEQVGCCAQELLECALFDDPRVIDWGCIQRGAAHVLARAQCEDDRQKAELARTIALRHRRDDGVLAGRERGRR